jgi:sec-independent protein translocase protein TatB
MDSFFGIGLPELIIILIIAGLIMGPQRIRKVAYTLGRVTAQLQAVSRQFARQLNAELDSLDDETIRGTMQDMRDLQKEVESLRRELRQVPKSLRSEGKSVVKEAEDAFQITKADNGKEIEADSAPSSSTQTESNQPERSPSESSEGESQKPERPSLPKAIDVPGDPE